MKKRIEKLEARRAESQRGVLIIDAAEWRAVWGDETTEPDSAFAAAWKDEHADKVIIIDDIPEAIQAQSEAAGAMPGAYSTGNQTNNRSPTGRNIRASKGFYFVKGS